MILQADTIIYDVKKIADYQSDPRYGYSSQLDLPEYSWFDIVARWFNRLINSLFNGKIEENVTTPILTAFFVICLLSALYFLYRKRPELFLKSRQKSSGVPHKAEEENIHDIDFEKDIASALAHGDYRLATRLKYLQTLRILSDNDLINWQIHKTPTEYIYELKSDRMIAAFRALTTYFLQIRYGNYHATKAIFDEMSLMQNRMFDSEGGAGI